MSVDYLFDFDVKYKSIENELKEKIAARTETSDDDYTLEDVENICDELYRYELMSVFGCTTFDNNKINLVSKILWDKTFYNTDVRENIKNILEELRLKKFIGIEIEEQILFSSLFCYELFDLTHKLIYNFSVNPTANVDKEIINKMIEEINKM